MKNCTDDRTCLNESLIEELTQALAALLWQHDNNDGTLCGMALQDARAALAKAQAQPEPLGSTVNPQDRTFKCMYCGGVMSWEDMENGWDLYYCQGETCRHQHTVAREYWTWYVNVYSISQGYGGPEEGGWWYNVGEPVTSVRCDTHTEAETMADILRKKYLNTGKSRSTLGGDDTPYPTERPHYE
jgi:hypothetical protein